MTPSDNAELEDLRRSLIDQRPIAIDLFSGVGGLALGLELAGFSTAVHVEVEDVTARYGRYNFPLAHHFSGEQAGDVTHLSGDALTRVIGGREVALLAGGPPCQGFSQAGRSRVDDPLNNLVLEMGRLIREVKPLTFLIENVPGIKRGAYWQLDEALSKLGDLYDINADGLTLSAPDFGVPQERKRVFYVGVRRDIGIAPPSALAPTHIRPEGQGALSALAPTPTVAEAISDLPDCDLYEHLIDGDEVTYEASPQSRFAVAMREGEALAQRRGYGVATDPTLCTNCRRTQHGDDLVQRLDRLSPGEVDPVSRIKRLDPDGLAPTIRAGTTKARGAWSAPRPCHPYRPRVVTTRECARFQTFPDWFRFHPAKWHGNRQVGNAVPPFLAEAVGEALVDLIGLHAQNGKQVPMIQRDVSLIEADVQAAAAARLSTRRTSHKVTGTNRAARQSAGSAPLPTG